jgi:hypothetical protein
MTCATAIEPVAVNSSQSYSRQSGHFTEKPSHTGWQMISFAPLNNSASPRVAPQDQQRICSIGSVGGMAAFSLSCVAAS